METPEQCGKSDDKLTSKTPEQHERRCSGAFTVNFENISHITLVFALLTLNK